MNDSHYTMNHPLLYRGFLCALIERGGAFEYRHLPFGRVFCAALEAAEKAGLRVGAKEILSCVDPVFDVSPHFLEMLAIGESDMILECRSNKVTSLISPYEARAELQQLPEPNTFRALAQMFLEIMVPDMLNSDEPRWGVWCVEDHNWCMIGTKAEAEAALPDWGSGRAANVHPSDFHYELHAVSQLSALPMGMVDVTKLPTKL